MATVHFDRDSMASWYAREHLETDPGITAVHYLPKNADDREIRLVEVNNLLGERTDEALEPIDFGVDMRSDNAHKLLILDVTPGQWDRIQTRQLSLPDGWTLDGIMTFAA